jgi:hypothetical protein
VIPWSTADSKEFRIAAAANVFDGSRHPSLTDLAANPPLDQVLPVSRHDEKTLDLLRQFQECLSTVLDRAGYLLNDLRRCLKKPSSTEGNIMDAVANVMDSLVFLGHLAWKSPFFESEFLSIFYIPHRRCFT